MNDAVAVCVDDNADVDDVELSLTGTNLVYTWHV